MPREEMTKAAISAAYERILQLVALMHRRSRPLHPPTKPKVELCHAVRPRGLCISSSRSVRVLCRREEHSAGIRPSLDQGDAGTRTQTGGGDGGRHRSGISAPWEIDDSMERVLNIFTLIVFISHPHKQFLKGEFLKLRVL